MNIFYHEFDPKISLSNYSKDDSEITFIKIKKNSKIFDHSDK